MPLPLLTDAVDLVPPRSVSVRANTHELEREVAQIWAEVLGISEIGPESHFFDLGGHSMLAVRMLIRVERKFGQRIEVATLFGTPTLREFVRELTGEAARDVQAAQETLNANNLRDDITQVRTRSQRQRLDPRIIAICRTGHKTPVFVVNNTAVLFPLAHALGEDRPLYALQLCPSTTPIELPQRDFRDLARDVVDLIREARPQGPYVLMGLCVFGLLAFEAAQQLRAAGEQVELVVINDAWAPGYIAALPESYRRRRAMLKRAHNVSLDVKRVLAGKKTPSEFVASYSVLRKLGVVDAGMRLGLLTPAVDEALLRAENRWYTDYLLSARSRYKERPYDGDMLVFRCEETLTGRYFDEDLGWRSVVRGRLHVMDCPGMHDEMYLPAGSKMMASGMRLMLRDA